MTLTKTLLEKLEPQLSEVAAVIKGQGKEYLIELPESYYQDSAKEDLDSLVARTSNAYARLARLTGMAHAVWKCYEVQYEIDWARSFRDSEGTNEGTRKADATTQNTQLAQKVAGYEATYRLLDRHTEAARVASESARKMASKHDQMREAEVRFDKGNLADKDFTK